MRASLREMTDQITPYDVLDMERFIAVQSKALNDTYDQNALLVSSNSELRMFLSFMPIKYREYVSKLKAESNILYRQQRVSPKVIQINDRGAEILIGPSTPQCQIPLFNTHFAMLSTQLSSTQESKWKGDSHCARALPATPPQE
jgi:hypothetical protein